MFGVYKLNREEWMKAKLNYAQKNVVLEREDGVGRVDYLCGSILTKTIKEIYDRLNEDINFNVLNDFSTSDIQRLTKYSYPIVSKIVDLFKDIGLFVVRDNAMAIDNCINNYLNNPIENYLVLRGFGEDINREIVCLHIESIWHNKLLSWFNFRINPKNHGLENINNVMKMPNNRMFDFAKIGFTLRIALSKGIVICNSKQDAKVLNVELERNNEASDFINRTIYIDDYNEISNKYKKKISRIKSHVDYSSMEDDVFLIRSITFDNKREYTLDDFKKEYKGLIAAQNLYLKECELYDKEKFNKIRSKASKDELLTILHEEFLEVKSYYLVIGKFVNFYNWIVDNQDILRPEKRLKLSYLQCINREAEDAINETVSKYGLGKYGDSLV
ncbi:MAG: hypothetical protein E7338_02760 [Clostridiales bacterium]|nr:hypothetical protein [Clostridiales bacterium]